MKNLFVLAALFCCLYAASACKKEKPAVVTGPVLTECLEAKLEEFKQLPWAVKIVRINRPKMWRVFHSHLFLWLWRVCAISVSLFFVVLAI